MSQSSGQSSSESGGIAKLLHPNNIETARDTLGLRRVEYYSRPYEPPHQQLINKIVSVKWGDGNIYTGKFSNQTRIRPYVGNGFTTFTDSNAKQYKFLYDDGDEKWYQLHKTVEGDIIAIDRYGYVQRFFFGPKSVEQNPKLTPHPTTTSGQNTQQSKSVYQGNSHQQLLLGDNKILPEYARETRTDESSGSRGGTRKRKTRKRRKKRKTRKRRKKNRKKRTKRRNNR